MVHNVQQIEKMLKNVELEKIERIHVYGYHYYIQNILYILRSIFIDLEEETKKLGEGEMETNDDDIHIHYDCLYTDFEWNFNWKKFGQISGQKKSIVKNDD